MSNSLSRQLRTALFYALRSAFRLTPMSQATRDRLRQRFLDTRGHWAPEGPKGRAPTGELPRRPYVRSDERAIGYVPYEKGELPDPLPATLVAFYLPQFHTIPENDEWWGKGFTEWRNVTRALPQFEGHYQPKLPGDLGFYDLRNIEVMHEQARLAREYGISAFCFYFYWFGGKTLLETPLRNWLNDKSIDLKFCLCWANEKWTRTWDGRGDEILIDQKHSPEDDIAFIEHVAEYMRDPRYLRVDGKPVLLVYRPGVFPDMKATAARWRTWCIAQGLGEIHLAYVQSFDSVDPREISFDAAVQFPPLRWNAPPLAATVNLINPTYSGQLMDWRGIAPAFDQQAAPPYRLHQGVSPGWDNEARRPGRGRCFLGASPDYYGKFLAGAIASTRSQWMSGPIFINAWNEWAEGAVLEPDARHGYAYLEATRRALHPLVPADARPCAIVHAWYPNALDDIIQALKSSGFNWRIIVTTAPQVFTEIHRSLESSGLEHELCVFENRGRDILPFLRTARRLLDKGSDLVLKLHTKRSTHRDDGDAWRKELLSQLADGGRASRIRDAMERAPEIGLVGPAAHVLPLSEYMGANAGEVSGLAARMGAHAPLEEYRFISGSMFWARLSALRPLLELDFLESEFVVEQGQTDGTMAHAVERAIGISTAVAGYRLETIEQLIGEPAPPTDRRYAYANRS